MTCGIYKLYYIQNEELVYIGRSVDIGSRHLAHIGQLTRLVHKNKLLQKLYIEYQQVPIMELVEEVALISEELYAREIFWIEKYNSFKEGMNETPGGEFSGYGEGNPNSKISNVQVVEILNTIIDYPGLPLKEVSTLLGVGCSIVRNIAAGTSHKWLSIEYPEKYLELMNLVGSRTLRHSAKVQGITYSKIVSPSGEVFTVECLRSFAREHNLHPSHLSEVLRGKAKSHKKWVKYAP